MLAVDADYESGTATIGTKPGDELSQPQILEALDKIGYSAQFGD